MHLHAGAAMIDLVDVNGQLEKGGDAPDPHRQNVDHLCLRIDPFNEDELLAYLRSQGSPSILLNRATARKATDRRFTSAIRTAIASSLRGRRSAEILALPLMSASRWLSTTRSDLF